MVRCPRLTEPVAVYTERYMHKFLQPSRSAIFDRHGRGEASSTDNSTSGYPVKEMAT